MISRPIFIFLRKYLYSHGLTNNLDASQASHHQLSMDHCAPAMVLSFDPILGTFISRGLKV